MTFSISSSIIYSIRYGISVRALKGGEVLSSDKVKENYLRRQAKRLGLCLRKSRARKWSLDNQGGYMITDIYTNFVIWGERYNLSIADVEELLSDYEKKLKDAKKQ